MPGRQVYLLADSQSVRANAIYAGIGLVRVFALFTVSLKVEGGFATRVTPEWR